MTAEILRVFTHGHNALKVAKQEYVMVMQYFREVLANRLTGVPEQRFRDALDRQSAARERYVELLTGER